MAYASELVRHAETHGNESALVTKPFRDASIVGAEASLLVAADRRHGQPVVEVALRDVRHAPIVGAAVVGDEVATEAVVRVPRQDRAC